MKRIDGLKAHILEIRYTGIGMNRFHRHISLYQPYGCAKQQPPRGFD